MKKIKLLFNVIRDLRSLANSLQAIADTMVDNRMAKMKKANKTKKAATKNTAGKDVKSSKQNPEGKLLMPKKICTVPTEKFLSRHTKKVEALLNQHDTNAKSVNSNTSKDNLNKCKLYGKYTGIVTDIYKGTISVRLHIGVDAITHSCYDNRMPSKNDEVSFIVTWINLNRNMVVGVISQIIK